jgi:alkanesulfonate monooxygenase SsuD/methylene tetrahydromethanopterin reductase-like flavin-dependent oxidoreductase (luciferase family)
VTLKKQQWRTDSARQIVGSAATVQVGLEKLVNATHADEVIVVTDTYEDSDRMDSYQRVARIAAEIKLLPC